MKGMFTYIYQTKVQPIEIKKTSEHICYNLTHLLKNAQKSRKKHELEPIILTLYRSKVSSTNTHIHFFPKENQQKHLSTRFEPPMFF